MNNPSPSTSKPPKELEYQGAGTDPWAPSAPKRISKPASFPPDTTPVPSSSQTALRNTKDKSSQTAPKATKGEPDQTMAPPNNQKRVKGVSIRRPFVYGTTARKFSETNPKPPGTSEEHTHSWTVFVKGVDDTDITYWCKKVQFKLHESIPNHLRMVENIQPGEPFEIHETGWGEFEIAIKIYYIPESLEKPQTVYHHLRLHPYGNTDEEKEKMEKEGEITSWCYDEQIFNEPYEQLYDILTSPMDRSKGGKGGMAKGTRVMKGGMVGSVGERTATLPLTSRPDQPFSIETERNEQRRLQAALSFVNAENARLERENKEKQETLAKMKAERQNAA